MLGYNRTIRITKNNVLLNIGPGAGEGREKKEVKKNTLPNNFDDNCTPEFVLFIVFLLKGIERNFKSCCGGQKKEKKWKEEKIKRQNKHCVPRTFFLSTVRVKLEILLTCHDHASSIKYYKPIQRSV